MKSTFALLASSCIVSEALLHMLQLKYVDRNEFEVLIIPILVDMGLCLDWDTLYAYSHLCSKVVQLYAYRG
jgi:hypothetical protein